MLAERFQPDFYEYMAGRVMVAEKGSAAELRLLEEIETKEDDIGS